MFRIVGLQILATAVVALAAWPLGGNAAAASAVFGGAAVFVPNALFALRLTLAARRPQGTSAATFFVGEFVKMGSTVALLALVVWVYQDVVWLALIASIVAALKSYMIALLFPWQR